MKRISIVVIFGLMIFGAAPIRLRAEVPAIASSLAFASETDLTQVHVKFQISEEKNGKREIVSRPVIRMQIGQPASVQVGQAGHGGGIAVELVAVTEAEEDPTPIESGQRDARESRAAAPASARIAITLRLSVTHMPETPNGSKLQAQFRVWNGVPTTIKVGPLEVQLTAAVVAAEPVKNADRRLGREEARLLAVLQKRISINHHDALLGDVVKELAKRSEANVVVELYALEDAGLTRQTRVTVSAQGLRLSTVLDQLLIPLGLDYVVADEVIKITSRTQARGEPVTVTYPVADLVTRIDGGRVVADTDAEQSLIEQITENLAPETWNRNGGRGSVRVFHATHTLVVRQVADVHDEITELLSRLRRTRKPVGMTPTATERPAAVEKPSDDLSAEDTSNRAE